MASKAEAFELARKLSQEKGGKPSEYIREAYEIINRGNGTTKTVRTSVEVRKTDKKEKLIVRGSKSALKALGRLAWKGTKEVTRRSYSHRDDFNFLKAPADKPSEIKTMTKIFGGTDPIPEIPESVKKLLKPW